MECSVEQCDRNAVARTWCLMHYKRWRNHGDPLTTTKSPPHLTAAEALEYGGWERMTDDCWEWARRNPAGYGLVWVDGRDRLAHRVAYETWVATIPDDLFVCHTCDNPPCINPDHLWFGSASDNNNDKEMKGRGNQPRGSKNANAKLTERDVVEVRRLRNEEHLTLKEIGNRFGITEAAVSAIVRRKLWKHV